MIRDPIDRPLREMRREHRDIHAEAGRLREPVGRAMDSLGV
ncbi:MAG TPA: hypothetical protein VLV15_09540 [Dongiaceae bacterium]|nr:hypothetical protein [Dongiaceae bacterium]